MLRPTSNYCAITLSADPRRHLPNSCNTMLTTCIPPRCEWFTTPTWPRMSTQSAFVALAQNARQLADHPVLSGWLHRTAQNLAVKTVRSDARRRTHEQEAAAMKGLLATEPDAVWEQIAPHLDAALRELSRADHDALTLRYFEPKWKPCVDSKSRSPGKQRNCCDSATK